MTTDIVSWTTLSIEKFDDLHQLPLESGLYVVLNKNEHILYVGKATKLRSRWWARNVAKYDNAKDLGNPSGWHSGSNLFWKPHKMLDHLLEEGCSLKYKLMNKLTAAHQELDLINKFKPEYNVHTC